MSQRFSLSTIWRRGRFESLKDFFESAQTLGIEDYELDATVSLSEISHLSLPENQISSLAIPCPAHPRNYDASFGSRDRYERDAAREAAMNSLELAVDLKTEVILMRPGRVDLDLDLEKALREAWSQAKAEDNLDSDQYQSLGRELIDLRARNAERHLEAVLYDVEYMANQAINHDLLLGLVTPAYYSHLGLPEEMYTILTEFGPPVYYWHDAGHAQILDTLNLVPQQDWFDRCAEHLIGTRLYDTLGLQRWHPPRPDGDVDFASLSRQLSTCAYITCVFAPAYDPQAVRTGLNDIQTHFERTEIETVENEINE